MKGKLFCVGLGPGDPALVTVKAVEVMGRCPVVAAPRTPSGEHMALDVARPYLRDQEILLCTLPMTRDAALLAKSRTRAVEQLRKALESGRDVALLTLGDPSVYATCGYLHRDVAKMGFEVEIIPGVPSFCAAAAALGEPLCEEDAPLHILPASYPGLKDALGLPGVKVLMKAGKKGGDILRLLEAEGLLIKTALVERCSLPEEKLLRAPEPSVDCGYFTVFIVGEKD